MPTPITVSVNFIDLVGTPINGYMVATIVPPTGVEDLYVAGVGIISSKSVTSAIGTSISVQVWGNDVVIDAADGGTDTYYTVNLFNSLNVLVWSAAYLFTGAGPINLVGFPILNPVPSPVTPTFPVVQPPGGSTPDIQFNNGGVFGGDSTFTFPNLNANGVKYLYLGDPFASFPVGITANDPASWDIKANIAIISNGGAHGETTGLQIMSYNNAASGGGAVGAFISARGEEPDGMFLETQVVLLSGHTIPADGIKGLDNELTIDGTGTVVDVDVIESELNMNSATAALTTGRHLHIRGNNGFNTITNIEGIHIAPLIKNGGYGKAIWIENQGLAANTYSIISDGGLNSFAGGLNIGGTVASGTVPLTVTQLGTGPTNVTNANLFLTDGVTPNVGAFFSVVGSTFRLRMDNLLVNSHGNLQYDATGCHIDGGSNSPGMALYTGTPAGGYTGITNQSAQIDLSGTGLLAVTANPGTGNNGEILLSPVTDTITFYGNTSGNASIGTNVVAGTPNQINLPTSTGSNHAVLVTDGGSPQQTSWTLSPLLSNITVTAATPTGSAGQVGFGTTAGFGAGSAGTAVTTTTKGAGTGPTTPQTVVNYLQIDIAGTKYWIPLVQ